MINRAGVFLLLFFSTANIYSQDLSGLKAMEIPQQLVLPQQDLLLKKIEDFKVLHGNVWEVYSDRTFNKTYTKPGGGSVFKSLQYLDKYYVAEVKKKYLHIVKDAFLRNNRTFSDSAEDYGWISLNKLLVWNHCLVDANQNNERGFIFYNADTKVYFKNENSNSGVIPDNFQIVYIFKKDNEKLLIGKSIRLSAKKLLIDESIIGWVNKDLVTLFPSNTFAEPCDEKIYGNEKLPKNIYNPVFLDKRSLIKALVKNKYNLTKILYKRNNNYEKFPPVVLRFPIISMVDTIATLLCYYPELNKNNPGEFNSFLEKTNAFYEGYCNVPIIKNGLSYNRVVLLDKSQLTRLISDINFLLILLTTEQDSDNVQEALKKHFDKSTKKGISISNDSFNFSILFEREYGILSNHLFQSLPLETLFSSSEIKEQYISKLKEKIRLLKKIFNNSDSDRLFISNNNQYYWIPGDYIP
jgi:hypothetical protein